jgi:hypothetical protein
MNALDEMIREYRSILQQEEQLDARKQELRLAMLSALAAQDLKFSVSPYGVAIRSTRYKLVPRREAVLGLLQAEDLLPFAQFTSARVKQHLVPKYGRERLLPLFDIVKTSVLVVKAPETVGTAQP